MKAAAFLVALFTIAVGVVGLVSPESLTMVRRVYFAAPAGVYAAAAIRGAMGLAVILCAPASRAPRILRVLGALMCMQGFSAALLGPERARTILEFEAMQSTALLRAGAAVSLAAGSFVAFALTGRRAEARAQ